MKNWWQKLLSEIVVCSICGFVVLVFLYYWHPATRQDIQRMSQQIERQNQRIDRLNREINVNRFEDRLFQRAEDVTEFTYQRRK